MSPGLSFPIVCIDSVVDTRRRCVQTSLARVREQSREDVSRCCVQELRQHSVVPERHHERRGLVSADRRHAGLQLRLVRLLWSHARDLMLQIPAGPRAQEVLDRQSAVDGEVPGRSTSRRSRLRVGSEWSAHREGFDEDKRSRRRLSHHQVRWILEDSSAGRLQTRGS